MTCTDYFSLRKHRLHQTIVITAMIRVRLHGASSDSSRPSPTSWPPSRRETPPECHLNVPRIHTINNATLFTVTLLFLSLFSNSVQRHCTCNMCSSWGLPTLVTAKCAMGTCDQGTHTHGYYRVRTGTQVRVCASIGSSSRILSFTVITLGYSNIATTTTFLPTSYLSG